MPTHTHHTHTHLQICLVHTLAVFWRQRVPTNERKVSLQWNIFSMASPQYLLLATLVQQVMQDAKAWQPWLDFCFWVTKFGIHVYSYGGESLSCKDTESFHLSSTQTNYFLFPCGLGTRLNSFWMEDANINNYTLSIAGGHAGCVQSVINKPLWLTLWLMGKLMGPSTGIL